MAGKVYQTSWNKTRKGKSLENSHGCTRDFFYQLLQNWSEQSCDVLQRPRAVLCRMTSARQIFSERTSHKATAPPLPVISWGRPMGNKLGNNIHLCWLLKVSSSAEPRTSHCPAVLHIPCSCWSLCPQVLPAWCCRWAHHPSPSHHPLWSTDVACLFF